eukprot:TCONS_00061384-protein
MSMSSNSPLGESIHNANEALSLCLSNKFNQAKDFIEPKNGDLMYHAISKGTISYLQAVLTYEPELIALAYEKVKDASILCDKYRKKYSWGETIQSFVSKQSYNDFTEEELHAELCYAECLLEWALLTFIQDENLMSFIKGGLKIKNAYGIYRNCMTALEEKSKTLQLSHHRSDFESGVYMGIGTFNLLLSLLPTRVLRLLEWVGFSGDKLQGLQWLDKGYHLDGLRSPMCTVSLLGYHIVASPLLGIGDTDIPYVQVILDVYLKKFPESSIFLYFSGRLKQTQGLLDEALHEYEKSVSGNIDWQQVHHICYWEMMWCYSFKADWKKAAEFAEKLSTESKWSKSSYLYMQAAFLLMQQFENELNEPTAQKDTDFDEKISNILHDVAKHKQRIAGKSLPFEKFACCRVEKYKATGTLILPAMELIHIWNGFTMFSNHTETLNHFMKLIKAALQKLEKRNDTSKHGHDNISLCYLLQGICLRYLKQSHEAEESLARVAKCSASQFSSKMDSYFPAWASAEIGFMYKELGEDEKALKQLQHTLKNYSKYGLESRLHFKVHSGIEVLKDKKRNPRKNHVTPTDQSDEDEEFADISDEPFDGSNGVGPYGNSDTSESSSLKSASSVNADLSNNKLTDLKNLDLNKPSKKNSIPSKSSMTSSPRDVTSTSTPSSNDVTPFHTPPSSSPVSEASSSISPKHSYNALGTPKDSPRLSCETSI